MMPRMRTIDQAAAWLQDNDPSTAFTKTALRRLVVSGKLPSVRIGQKYLVDLNTLEVYLRGQVSAPVLVQGIRKVQL